VFYNRRITRTSRIAMTAVIAAVLFAAVPLLPLAAHAGFLFTALAFLPGCAALAVLALLAAQATGVPGVVAAFVETVPQGALLAREGRVVMANERACRMLGRDKDALLGMPLADAARPEDLAYLLGSREGDPEARELAFTRGDGSTAWVEAGVARVPWGRDAAVLVSMVDAGARREAEETRRGLAELARCQEEQLEHSTRLAELGEMAAAISHELNQPLTGIRNYARNAFYMIDQKAGGENEVKDNLRLISGQVDRAAKIINQMRELTRRSDSTFAPLSINSVIRECVEFLLPQMKLSEVTVTLALDESLPSLWGDRIRLAQVFLNLLSNARQAMDGAPVRRLSVSTMPDPGAPLGVVAEVRDTGKGFSDEQKRSLFQPFYTTRKGGHGLGLSISRAIVQDHQGVIEAAGVPGAGATFTVRLPAARGAQAGSGA
jgi:PAS domain S-box-containing protein